MSGHVFVCFWPIIDDQRPFRALVAEALPELYERATAAGARLAGNPRWRVTPDNRLVAHVPAELLPPGQMPYTTRPGIKATPALVNRIREMADSGTSKSAIARDLDIDRKTVIKYLRPERKAA